MEFKSIIKGLFLQRKSESAQILRLKGRRLFDAQAQEFLTVRELVQRMLQDPELKVFENSFSAKTELYRRLRKI